MKNHLFLAGTFLSLISAGVSMHGQSLPVRTDGTSLGIYPGNPKENFSPKISSDNVRRNIALNRAAFSSDSYDYNLAAQLVTDGMIPSGNIPMLLVNGSEGLMARRGREGMLDFGEWSRNEFHGDKIWYEIATKGYSVSCDSLAIIGRIYFTNKSRPQTISVTCYGSDNGKNWKLAGKSVLPVTPPKGISSEEWALDPNKLTDVVGKKESLQLRESLKFKGRKKYSYWKIELEAPGVELWQINQTNFYEKSKVVDVKPSNHFYSAWVDAGHETPWVAIDLGPNAKYDEVSIHWIIPPKSGTIEVSDDGINWEKITTYNAPKANTVIYPLGSERNARYIRTVMERKSESEPIAIGEFEVFGIGGAKVIPDQRPLPQNGIANLSGGEWKLFRDNGNKGETVSSPGFEPQNWIQATVPATILTSYVNAGAVPNPNYADAENMISDSFFNSDFWYQTEFEIPEDMKDKELFLNFDGINWKAEVFLNGKEIGRIDGAFKRGRFNISDLVKPGENILAVKIIKNANPGSIKEKGRDHPGFNGGILGADNPTFHATIGWDWISTIRGRNSGIWNDVYISSEGPAGVSDPLVETKLKGEDGSIAEVTPSVIVTNNTSKETGGIVRGTIGDIEFQKVVSLKPNETKEVKFSPSEFPQLVIKNPRLWWPNGYGSPEMYPASFTFIANNKVSNKINYNAGLREMTYGEGPEGRLHIYINGKRFVGRGGNWGMSEANLNFREREYEIAAAYHNDMNMNIIRNWVGMTGDEEFYDACDRNGIMVWQDFWLANPADGPDPADNKMFMENADDYIRKIRRHPSLAIYCGRNEGNPPEILDTQLRESVAINHPGMKYISNSADNGVSGHGPYRMLDAKEYFTLETGNNTFHTERGMPNVLTYESMERTFSPDALADFSNKEWGMHDFTLEGAQGATSFNQLIDTLYGKPKDIRDFSRKAQMVNYDGHRAMFESRSNNRQGLLMWMSHSCWPSMVWQTYDYFFEPTAGYFGIKKASEPLHIQWNPSNDDVEVVNYSVPTKKDLNVNARILDLNGKVNWEKSLITDSETDTTLPVIKLELPKEPGLSLIDLSLTEGTDTISSNRYLYSSEPDGNRLALNSLPNADLSVSASGERELKADIFEGKVTITNNGKTIVPAIRINVVGEKDGKQILPAIYSDNYFILLPGESKTVNFTYKLNDSRNQNPVIEIESYGSEKPLVIKPAIK